MNIIIISGNLGKDPEVKTLESGKRVANFSVGVSDGYGEQKKTFWFNVVAWDKTAEFVDTYLKKGAKVVVQGRCTVRSYEHDGTTKYITEIVSSNIEFTGNKGPETKTDDDLPF